MASNKVVLLYVALLLTGHAEASWSERTVGSGSEQWRSITSSDDGTKLAAVAMGGNIWTSSDSGASWTERTVGGGSEQWRSITSSDDGTKLAAVANLGNIWTSSDSGVSWTERTVGGSFKSWLRITSSDNGTKLAAAALGGNIWTSSDSGVSWTERTVGGASKAWYGITSSDDGTKLAAVVNGGNIWTSSDSGVSWTVRIVGGGSEQWRSITSSDNGTKLAAVAYSGSIWTSSDSGVSWTESTVGSELWYSITSSDDGTKLAAVASSGNIWVSPAPLVPPEGCPDTINYVDTEGSFDLSVAAPTPSPGAGRDCTVLFRSPPGSVLAFDWKNFNVGSCSSESVILKDGWSDTESNKVGETLCGSSTPPSTTYFSGNTARLELKLESTSTFWIWVNHFRNHFTFDIPHSTFQLGSDISISYSLSLAQNSLPTSTYTLNAPSSASHPTDSGWVGLYRDGTCGTGAEAHECYLASRAAPAGENQVRFYFDDYKRAGWYEVRYFAGESAGTTCGIPQELTNVNQTIWVVPNRCTFEPISTARFYVTADAEEMVPAAMKAAIPGYERRVME